MCYYEALCKGVSSFAAARQTGKRKYERVGRQVHRRVKSWIEKGNPNLGHIDTLLEAEHAALRGKKFVARQKYELAILLSARGGLLLDTGFAAERFGEFYLEHGETEEAIFRLKQAMKYFREVGADGKARHLEEKHAKLWPPPAGVVEVPSGSATTFTVSSP